MGRDIEVPVTWAPGPIGPGFPETGAFWQGHDTQNSPREASLCRDLLPHLGSAPSAFPAAPPPPPLRHPSGGGCGGPTALRGPPGGSSPCRDGFGSDCHITRCYIPPWGLGPGGAGETRCFTKRKRRQVLEPPRENTGTVSRDLSSRGRLRLRLRLLAHSSSGSGQTANTTESSRFAGSVAALARLSEGRLRDPQEPWGHQLRPGSGPASTRSWGAGEGEDQV